MADFTEAQWAELQRNRGQAAAQPQLEKRGRPRHEQGKMNKREALYAHYLELRKITGEIIEWRFEAVRLTLAPKTTLTIDFAVIMPDGSIEMHEVKGGHWEDDARAKIKIAAVMFFEYKFLAATFETKTGWQFEHFKGA